MWLRQVALVVHDLKPVVEQLGNVLGLKVAFNDPAVGMFGLVNAVMPVGDEFLEVVQPVKDDASASRYLHRRGGDAGYMVILQTGDALAERKRILGLGARKIAEHEGASVFTHFHPGDFGGVLTSVDSVTGVENWFDHDSDWPYAGRDWRKARNDISTGILAVTIQGRAPEALAARWAQLLDQPLREGARGPEIALRRGVIRFVEPVDADGTGVVGIDIAVADPQACLERARTVGVLVEGNAVRICGTSFELVRA
ncbi:hypothetical protein F2P47_08520 [Parvibaculum sedimenti]|uniref:Glyoxalase-like domain-containing protein n=1 Tax=Parvibaculum sedimenti TaxID=2608632 RepID=A0A6N6VM51_9HYPH|nr:VOC family protein [Parvibaculum sedimenti]KAB7740560.1 hypothetical protein F2P47_08520 [Parvibaculum sedimenti]